MSKIWIDVTNVIAGFEIHGYSRIEAEISRAALTLPPVGFLLFEQEEVFEISHDQLRESIALKPKTAGSISNKEPQAKLGLFLAKVFSTIKQLADSYRLSTQQILLTPARNVLRNSAIAFLGPLRRYMDVRNPPALVVGGMSWTSKPEIRSSVAFEPDDWIVFTGAAWKTSNLLALERFRENNKLRYSFLVADLVPMKFPHLVLREHLRHWVTYFSYLPWIADNIFVLSRSGSLEVDQLLKGAGRQLEVRVNMLEPSAEHVLRVSPSKPAGLSSGPFFLAVSTIEARKNHHFILEVFRRLIESGEDPPTLILVGKYGWGSELIKNAVDLDPTFGPRGDRKVVVLQSASDSELAWLYKNAVATLQASHHEGWGFAVQEALAHGSRVLVSDKGALPEFEQKGAVVIPLDVKVWIEHLLAAVELRDVTSSAAHDSNPVPGLTWAETLGNLISTLDEI
tara:strand:- start:9618 stop:10979 length:1362 start_codon:yes stop_codon:yes gene_type:complete